MCRVLVLLLLILSAPVCTAGQEIQPAEPGESRGEQLIGYDIDSASLDVTEEVASSCLSPWWWTLPTALLLLAAISWGIRRSAAGKEESVERGPLGRMTEVLVFLALLISAILVAQSFVLAQQRDIAGETRTRVRHGNCEIGSSFGIRIVDPQNNVLTGKRKVLFNTLKPGVRVDSNARVVVQSENTTVSPYPGTVTFTFYRGPGGQDQFHRLSGHANNERDLKAVVGQQAPELVAPPGMSAQNNRVTEIIRIVGHWDPDNIDDECTVQDQLTIIWRFNASRQSSSFEPLQPAPDSRPPAWRSAVRFSPEIMEETTGFPGHTNFATETAVLFSVDDAFRCCDQPNKQYSIVQFVKHRWRTGNHPPVSDAWNLDGPDSQAGNHEQGNPYDPTFAPTSSGLIQVGPWSHKGGDAISVRDYPGLLETDHGRFMQQGGIIEWEFWTLLVCLEEPLTAEQYLNNGKVQAITHFKITRTYPGNNEKPVVNAEIFRSDRKYFNPCVSLADVLGDRGLLDAFNNPRRHQIPFGW